MGQTTDDTVVIPKLPTMRDNRRFMRKRDEYGTQRSHRYLGIIYVASNSNHLEVAKRIASANGGWKEL